MYKLQAPDFDGKVYGVKRLDDDTSIPFAPDNADYQNFKYQINNDEAQLEDADGVVMSPEAAKAYVATLP
jgi:hypothetical protein